MYGRGTTWGFMRGIQRWIGTMSRCRCPARRLRELWITASPRGVQGPEGALTRFKASYLNASTIDFTCLVSGVGYSWPIETRLIGCLPGTSCYLRLLEACPSAYTSIKPGESVSWLTCRSYLLLSRFPLTTGSSAVHSRNSIADAIINSDRLMDEGMPCSAAVNATSWLRFLAAVTRAGCILSQGGISFPRGFSRGLNFPMLR